MTLQRRAFVVANYIVAIAINSLSRRFCRTLLHVANCVVNDRAPLLSCLSYWTAPLWKWPPCPTSRALSADTKLCPALRIDCGKIAMHISTGKR